MVNQKRLQELLILFAEGKISRSEYDELLNHINTCSEDVSFDTAIDHVFKEIKHYNLLNSEAKEQVYQNIIQGIRFEQALKPVTKKGIWVPLSIAASILVLIAAAMFFYTPKTSEPKLAVKTTKPKTINIIPGGDKAVLTLSDGSRIILDHAKNGILANQSGVSIQKTSNGKLEYSFSNLDSISLKEDHSENVFNTIETPAGGKYQVNLPDGSKVWLNASSSLRFPARFLGKTREVELTGEAFFDVAKNKHMPFKVITKDQIVEVLGTRFNINSYADEGVIKTTLIEGSVKIIYKDEVVLLSPGQQFNPMQANAKVVEADTDEVIAWKNGYFLFKNEDIQSVMRKISRWYNVDVSYSGDIPKVGFGGNISRSKDIYEVLDVLQLTNAVHFKIEGRRIIIMQ